MSNPRTTGGDSITKKGQEKEGRDEEESKKKQTKQTEKLKTSSLPITLLSTQFIQQTAAQDAYGASRTGCTYNKGWKPDVFEKIENRVKTLFEEKKTISDDNTSKISPVRLLDEL